MQARIIEATSLAAAEAELPPAEDGWHWALVDIKSSARGGYRFCFVLMCWMF